MVQVMGGGYDNDGPTYKFLNDVDEEEYSAIYMSYISIYTDTYIYIYIYIYLYTDSCTPYELYFNEAIDNHVYVCVNVNNLTQRDIKIKNSQYTSKWHTFNDKYFNIHNDYKLIQNYYQY